VLNLVRVLLESFGESEMEVVERGLVSWEYLTLLLLLDVE
jgi:hypothetical protein